MTEFFRIVFSYKFTIVIRFDTITPVSFDACNLWINDMQNLPIITAKFFFFTLGNEDSLIFEDLTLTFCIFLFLGNQTGVKQGYWVYSLLEATL